MKRTAVIMAGGKGERFWPKSRASMPKQFLSLTQNGKTMIQLTVERLLPLVAYEDIYIVTNQDYVNLVQEQLPEIPPENILAEPMAKNTAPCIGFAAAVIRKKYQDAIMLVLPSDHLIKNNEIYIDVLRQAIHIACDANNLVTIGITPTYPETGYGYIHFALAESGGGYTGCYSVKGFVEKPDIDKAKEYLACGQYLWNSGMFVWKVSTIMKQFEILMPEIYTGLLQIEQAVETDCFVQVLYDTFLRFTSESIDFGVMEHAKNIYTIPGNFGWDDVGSWLALERINKTDEFGNLIQGNVITVRTNNTTILAGEKLIAAVGVENLVIVDTDDVLLVCAKDYAQEIKKVIEKLKESEPFPKK